MRLIDAEKCPCNGCGVMYCYKNCKEYDEWFNGCDYDVEAVVAELEYEKEKCEEDRTYWSEYSWKDSLMYNECDMSDRKADCFEKAIEIVQGKE